MPKITPARPDAHPPHAESEPEFGAGWCLPCYAVGSYSFPADPTLSLCVVHAHDNLSGPDSTAGPDGPAAPPPGPKRRSRPPRGRAARAPGSPPTHRPWVGRRTAAHTRARGMAYGRRRAAIRVTSGRYTPHPGWRHLIDSQHRVLTDQTEALAVVDKLVDDQDWRSDKRTAWAAILRQLVCSMDWTTGVITAVTLARLGHAGARAPRTVSRVIAWAREASLLVVIEHGASAQFLHTEHGRTPSYVLVAPLVATTPPPAPAADGPDPADTTSAQLSTAVDENGVLPVSNVGNKPLNGRRPEPAEPAPAGWPVYGVPQTAPDRTAATRCLFQRLGLDQRGVSGVPLWRARALLRPWWDAGACPAALLHAIDRHPDHPNHHRGDALRGARDPLRVLASRLRPWQNRLHELPTKLVGIPGNYTIGTTAPLHAADVSPSGDEPGEPFTPSSSAAHRAALRAQRAQERQAQVQQRRILHPGDPGGRWFVQTAQVNEPAVQELGQVPPGRELAPSILATATR